MMTGCIFDGNSVHSLILYNPCAIAISIIQHSGSVEIANTTFRDIVGLVNPTTMKLFGFNLNMYSTS